MYVPWQEVVVDVQTFDKYNMERGPKIDLFYVWLA